MVKLIAKVVLCFILLAGGLNIGFNLMNQPDTFLLLVGIGVVLLSIASVNKLARWLFL
jgi:hypothetical protein